MKSKRGATQSFFSVTVLAKCQLAFQVRDPASLLDLRTNAAILSRSTGVATGWTPVAVSVRMPSTLPGTQWLIGDPERKCCDAGSKIEALLGLNGNRLQGNRTVLASD